MPSSPEQNRASRSESSDTLSGGVSPSQGDRYEGTQNLRFLPKGHLRGQMGIVRKVAKLRNESFLDAYQRMVEAMANNGDTFLDYYIGSVIGDAALRTNVVIERDATDETPEKRAA